ncbi:DgyrCDS8822 [Dimorphilus gyrociliatus]|uniref:Gamma-aminobutyric acid type B receptor subunit 2 n=1 Tax=Dimorphilus gyrociliatus TaxID=2664684 RepID=A0A7I8VVI9_9ANNE|nr:DgyrCDS8822 [Dimorphilus gyrociliatus]
MFAYRLLIGHQYALFFLCFGPFSCVGKASDCCSNSNVSERTRNGLLKVNIGGLFELENSTSKPEFIAANLAIDHVNKGGFVPGIRLSLFENDTKCDPGRGADAFYDFMYKKPKLFFLVGTKCSEISYGAVSPALSDREKYPTFFRTAAADSSHNDARIQFFRNFNWSTFATIHQDQEIFSLAINDLTRALEKANMTIEMATTFRGTGSDVSVKMNMLKEADARIIIGSFQEDAARQVFCEAYKLGLHSPRYIWVLHGWYSPSWWKDPKGTTCKSEELLIAVDGYISVDSVSVFRDAQTSDKGISGLTADEFATLLAKETNQIPSIHAPLAYDAIWALAYVLRKYQLNRYIPKLSDFNYSTKNGSEIVALLSNLLSNLEFTGVSGPVSFHGSDRQGVSVLEQNQRGMKRIVALFYPEKNSLDFNCKSCKQIYWKNGKVPKDKKMVITQAQRIDEDTFIAVCVISIFGITVAISFLIFNLYYRKLKYIKLSSPKLNDMALIGCILVYTSVILFGLDDGNVKEEHFAVICSSRAFLLAAGFSAAFGAMFTKTYRVHEIFTRAHSGIIRSKLLKDKQLLTIISALLFIDCAIILLWVAVDPMKRRTNNFTKESDDGDVTYIYKISHCDSEHSDTWLGALYAYKGALLIFGVYMAWETRHVKIPALNDSHYIGMNVYNVVLTSAIVVALSSILADRPTLCYAVVSGLIVVSTTSSLALLFLPKIYAIVKHNGNPVIVSTGITVEANTRRFVVEDKREVYYRAQVQNRVYKRQLAELDQEIIHLQDLLSISVPPVGPLSEDLLALLPIGEGESRDENQCMIRDYELERIEKRGETSKFLRKFSVATLLDKNNWLSNQGTCSLDENRRKSECFYSSNVEDFLKECQDIIKNRDYRENTPTSSVRGISESKEDESSL